jgi:hypothetical protein
MSWRRRGPRSARAIPCRANVLAKRNAKGYSGAVRTIFLVAMLFLGSCANIQEATPAGGILKVVGGKDGTALAKAQAHCAQYGKNARISGQNVWNNTVTFDCV